MDATEAILVKLMLFIGIPAGVLWIVMTSSARTGSAAIVAGVLLGILELGQPRAGIMLFCLLFIISVGRRKWFRAQRWPVRVVGVCGMLAAFGMLTYQLVWNRFGDRLQMRAELREKYPIESLEERLAWQDRQPSITGPHRQPVMAPVPLGETVLFELGRQEGQAGGNYRTGMLRDLHDLHRDEFFRSAGFGVLRMRYVQRSVVEYPEPQSFVLPDPPPARPAPSFGDPKDALESVTPEIEDAGGPLADSRLPGAGSPAETLRNIYQNGLEDFTDPDQLGWIPEPGKAAGFTAHSVDFVPGTAHGMSREAARMYQRSGEIPPDICAPEDLKITRLELVSLLKHAGPVVYESRELPRMDRLANAPTRPLSGFERRSLRELRGERDLVTDEHNGRVLMLGAIRAAKQCLNCHSVQRGTLLGAFSYEIWLPGAAPMEAPPTEDLPPST